MDHVASVLSKVLRRRGLLVHADAALVAHEAKTWLLAEMPLMGRWFEIRSYKEGVLLIGCPHSIAAQECQAVGHRLLEHLRKLMPKNEFSAIRIVRIDPPVAETALA